MRHCFGEKVQVWEERGEDLPEILRNAADLLGELDPSYAMVHTSFDEGKYEVTLYVH